MATTRVKLPEAITPTLEPTPEPVKAAKPKKLTKAEQAKAELHTYTTDGDLASIWERRMLHPTQRETKHIHIKRAGMHLRWINLTNTARYQRARYEQGWEPVHKSELKDEREIYGCTFTTEGWVCRGEKQSEMLMMMPDVVFKKIQQAKYDEVQKSRKHIKENLQGAGAKHFSNKYNSNTGHEIADKFSAFKGNVEFGIDHDTATSDAYKDDLEKAGLTGE